MVKLLVLFSLRDKQHNTFIKVQNLLKHKLECLGVFRDTSLFSRVASRLVLMQLAALMY